MVAEAGFALRDINNDNIPELFVLDWWMTSPGLRVQMFSIQNGAVEHLFSIPGSMIYYDPTGKNIGVFSPYRLSAEYGGLYYYTISNGNVVETTVLTRNQQNTDNIIHNQSLYNAYLLASNKDSCLDFEGYSNITINTWNTFCAKFGY